MKSKKLISFLCAAALTASSFAALTINASAATEDDILWSDTFDNASTGVFLDGTNSNAATNSDAISGLTFVTTNRGSGDKGSYTASDGSYIYNGSYYAAYEKDDDATDKYLRLSFPVFGDFTGTGGRWAYVSLGESGYAATADTDVVMDFDLKLENGLDAGVVSTDGTDNPVLRIGSFDADAKTATAVEIDKADLGIGDDWVHARIVVSATDGAKLYIDGTEMTAAANADVTSLVTIGLYNDDSTACGSAMADLVGNNDYDKDGTLNDVDAQTLTPNADLDNVIIYSETAGVATGTSDAPGAQSQDAGATIAPVATSVPIGTAPVLVAPESADEDTLSSFTFDSDAIAKWSLGTTSQSITDIDGMTIDIGGRSNGGNVDTYAAVVAADSGNVLRLQAGPYAHAGRGPVLSFNESMPISYDDGTATALSFAVKLSAPEGYEDSETTAPRLYFLKSNSQAGDDNTGAYNQVAAVLTAVEGETIYRGESDVISTYITPDEWHYVTFVVTPDSASGATQRLYVDGAEEASVKCSYVGTGDTATYMDDLPLLAVESKAAKISGSDVAPDYSLATIDNILIYQGQPSEARRMVATVSEVEATEAPEVTEAPTPEPVANVTMTVTENDDNTATVSMTSDMDTDAVLIQAEYTDTGALNGVKVLKELTLTNGVAATETLTDLVQNDKIMLWNSLSKMQPLADAYTVVGGAAQATDAPAPTAEPTEAPTEEPSTEATTAPTEEPSTEATTAPTEEPSTEVTTYKVTGTVDEGVESVTLTEVVTEGTAATYTAEISDTTATFTGVAAGTYTVSAEAADGYTDATVAYTTEGATSITVTSADVTSAFTVTTTTYIKVPTLTGVTLDENDFSDTDDTWDFIGNRSGSVLNSSGALSILNNVNASSANQIDYKIFDTTISRSTSTEIIFDYLPQIDESKNRASVLELSDGTSQTDVGNVIFSLVAVGNAGVSYGVGKSLSAIDSTTQVASLGGTSTALRVYLNMVAGESSSVVSGYIFDITGDTPLCVAEIPETEITATSLNRMAVTMINSLAPVNIDNVKITTHDEGVYVVSVTTPDAEDGTLTVSQQTAMKDDVLTITPKAVDGKKVATVTVDGTAIEANEGVYTYTVTGEEEAIAIAATFARADATSVSVTGTAQVQQGYTSEYTATVMADTVDITDASEITWSLAIPESDDSAVSKIADGTSIDTEGKLTVAEGQATGNLNVVAKVVADVTATEETYVTGTYAVAIVSEPVYTITKTDVTEGGSFVVNGSEGTEVETAKEDDVLTVVPTAATGYEVDTVTYTLEGDEVKTVEKSDSGYQITVGTVNITVTVTFKLIDYSITNSTSSTAVTDGAPYIKVTTQSATDTEVSTANYGDDMLVTIVQDEQDTNEYYVTLTVTDASDGTVATTKTSDTTYTFSMPASNVTVSATFETLYGLYELDLSEATTGMVSYALTDSDIATLSSVEDSEIAVANVADFGTNYDSTNYVDENRKTATVVALDGWAYRHGAYSSAADNSGNFTSRQTSMSIDTSNNAVLANGRANDKVSCDVSFILANVDNVTVPTSGRLIYTFDVYNLYNTQNGVITLGLTSSSGDTLPTVTAVGTAASITNTDSAATSIDTATAHPVEIVIDIDNSTYTMSVDGAVVTSGTSSDITGIYMTTNSNRYTSGVIKDLVVKTTTDTEVAD